MFPRVEGHCYSHHIPGDYIYQLEQIRLYDELTLCYRLELALKYLKEKNADLRYGDLVIFDGESNYRNRNIRIFDGDDIIDLQPRNGGYRTLPQQFRVIENNVPIIYWYNDPNNKDKTREGLSVYETSWFDHKEVRDQCINNIKGEIVDGTLIFSTTFTYKDQGKYTIEYLPAVNTIKYGIDHILDRFREYFEEDGLIEFNTDSWTYENNNRTLFLDEDAFSP